MPIPAARDLANHTPRRRRLTLLQRRYLRNLKDGQARYRAALNAGYSRAAAESPACKIEKSPVLHQAIERWLRRDGLDDQSLEAIEGR